MDDKKLFESVFLTVVFVLVALFFFRQSAELMLLLMGVMALFGLRAIFKGLDAENHLSVAFGVFLFVILLVFVPLQSIGFIGALSETLAFFVSNYLLLIFFAALALVFFRKKSSVSAGK